MLAQNDKQLRKEINLYGCNFMCHIALGLDSKGYSSDAIHQIYQEALQKGYIDQNCTVKDPNNLIALATPKGQQPLRQIGGILFSDSSSWGMAETHSSIRYRVARWRQRNPRHFHFTLFNLHGEIYDPFDATNANYKLEKMENLGYQLYG